MAAAEHVKRQVAVAIVIAVEEPPLLLAVQRIIRRIEVENDLPGRPRMRLQEQVDQQRPDRDRIVADLVVARRRKLALLRDNLDEKGGGDQSFEAAAGSGVMIVADLKLCKGFFGAAV